MNAIARLSTAMAEDPDLVEVDLNPIISSSNGTFAVDALVVVTP